MSTFPYTESFHFRTSSGFGNFIHEAKIQLTLSAYTYDKLGLGYGLLQPPDIGNAVRNLSTTEDVIRIFDKGAFDSPIFMYVACPGFTSSSDKLHKFEREMTKGTSCQDYPGAYSMPEMRRCCKSIEQLWKDLRGKLEPILIPSIQQPSGFLPSEGIYTPIKDLVAPSDPPHFKSLWPLIHQCQLQVMDDQIDCSGDFNPGPSLSGLAYSLNRVSLESIVSDAANDLYTKTLRGSSQDNRLLVPPGQFRLTAVIMQDNLVDRYMLQAAAAKWE